MPERPPEGRGGAGRNQRGGDGGGLARVLLGGRSVRVPPSIALLLALAFPATRLSAQAAANAAWCEGRTVARVEIDAGRPPFSGTGARWRRAARAVGLHHLTTTDDVIRAFLALHVGRPCTEFRRAESERVLRSQPFLADAHVRVIPDTGGTVAALVTTTDEVPVLVNARFRGVAPEALSLGNLNVGGQGLRLEGRVERGRAYRTAVGATIEQSAIFQRPYRLRLELDRYQVGYRAMAMLEHPFYTDLQRVSWNAGYETRTDYLRFARPARDALALPLTDARYTVSGVVRVFGTGTVTLVGGAFSGRQVEPARGAVVVTDSGLAADTGTTLTGRYAPFRAGRLGAITGLRRIRFHTVTGFDALVAPQDVATGVAAGVFVAQGLTAFGTRDQLLSTALYGGVGGRRTLLASLVQAEARRDPRADGWDSMIASARTALYWGRAPGLVVVLADEYSGGRVPRLPLQLTFDDRIGGISAYRNSALAGAQRNVARGELRWSAASAVRRADLGVALFGESGTLWAGGAPYGVNATRTAVGIGLLAAYPTGSKRLYRADFSFPLTRRGEGAGRFEVRFSSVDRTQGFWREPDDVSRARTGVVPSSLFAWPTQ